MTATRTGTGVTLELSIDDYDLMLILFGSWIAAGYGGFTLDEDVKRRVAGFIGDALGALKNAPPGPPAA